MKTIEEYAELFTRMGLTELYVEEDGNKLRLKKETAPRIITGRPGAESLSAVTTDLCVDNSCHAGDDEVTSDVADKVADRSTPAAKPAEEAAPKQAAEPAGETVKAPLLGIFHAAVGGSVRAAGDSIRKGEALCTIEAMKMMNEVCAPRDGVIREVLAADGALVEYHQPLFILE